MHKNTPIINGKPQNFPLEIVSGQVPVHISQWLLTCVTLSPSHLCYSLTCVKPCLSCVTLSHLLLSHVLLSHMCYSLTCGPQGGFFAVEALLRGAIYIFELLNKCSLFSLQAK